MKNQKPYKKKKGSTIRTILEFIMFITWLFITGLAGYFMGQTPALKKCNTIENEVQTKSNDMKSVSSVSDCFYDSSTSGSGIGLGVAYHKDGYSYKELIRMWTCSQATAEFTQANKLIYPKNQDKTKWQSIISFEPKAFFQKYLSQYPADIKAVQPVIVFSHKPLAKFEELSDVCKVLDISVVPDSPDVCVAVTETYHDVASYHMLHADKQPDGTFALTSNHIKERVLPEEVHYKAARSLLLDYFNNIVSLETAVKSCPKLASGVSIGTLVESVEELELFKNSLMTAKKQNIALNKRCVFTTSKEVNSALTGQDMQVILLTSVGVGQIGRVGDSKVDEEFRVYFLQAMLAFAVANTNNKMLWQSPGTLWFDKPDNIIEKAPVTETLFSFKGRKDPRAAPFFVSFDFFVVTGHERAVHLMHELILNFDLVLSWQSLDSVLAYRLSENNARYGTTTYQWPPYVVLHTDLLGNNVEKMKGVADLVRSSGSGEKPQAIVLPRQGRTATETKQLLIAANLWFL